MLILQIFSAVTALTLVVVAYYLIPVLLELKKAASSVSSTSESLLLEIKPLVKELRDTIADVQVVTSSAAANADGVNLLLEELGHAGHNIRIINRVLGVASQVAAGSSAWMTGARVAGKFLADRLSKKIRG
jgi:uncharacterized protein YoxC